MSSTSTAVTGGVAERLRAGGRTGRTPFRRVVDVALVVPALIVSSPVWLIIAIVIRRADAGSVFFVQDRIGQGGRPFGMLKFRTMYRDADVRLHHVLAENPDRRREWESTYKLDPDPRLLPEIGEFLRRSSLDELPNLLNVLRGDMTVVGPRPFPAYHLEAYPTALRELRSLVKPGLTGLWQVERGDLASQMSCDERYLQRTSARYDLGLVLRTIPLLLRGKARY